MNQKFKKVKKSIYYIITAIFFMAFVAPISMAADHQRVAPLTAHDIQILQDKADSEGHNFKLGQSAATERPSYFLHGRIDPDSTHSYLLNSVYNEPLQTYGTLPSSWDWRTNGGSVTVRDQGNCGSCWAFSTMGPLEHAIKIKDGVELNLAEQQLVDCNTHNYGCANGGYNSMDMLKSNGAALETCYPYTAKDGTCKTSCALGHKIDSWAWVAGSSNGTPTTDQIKAAIYTYGPISVSVACDSTFDAYKSGVFTHNYTGSLNHMVVLVGWSDTDGAWIMRNSWGTSWGESGYMRIKYGVSKIGSEAAYLVYSGSTPVDTVTEITNGSSVSVAGQMENVVS